MQPVEGNTYLNHFCDQVTAQVADAVERGLLLGILRVAPLPPERQSLEQLRAEARGALPRALEPEAKKKR